MTFEAMVKQVREDFHVHRQDWTRPGFQTVAAHRFGSWVSTVEPRLVRGALRLLSRAMERFCRNVYGIELPHSVQLGRSVLIEHQGGIVIHGDAVIGDYCVIRQGVTLGAKNMLTNPREVPRIGNGVDIGAGAKIMGKISVGDGASIGANAVVLIDVPAGALAVGVPARIVLAGHARREDGTNAC